MFSEEEGSSYFVFENKGCRTSHGWKGSAGHEYDLYMHTSLHDCQAKCTHAGGMCYGYEHDYWSNKCEVWKVFIDKHRLEYVHGLDCYIKTFQFQPQPSPSTSSWCTECRHKQASGIRIGCPDCGPRTNEITETEFDEQVAEASSATMMANDPPELELEDTMFEEDWEKEFLAADADDTNAAIAKPIEKFSFVPASVSSLHADEDETEESTAEDLELVTFCSSDVKRCPDGSYVSRDHFNHCNWKPCPHSHHGGSWCTECRRKQARGSRIGCPGCGPRTLI